MDASHMLSPLEAFPIRAPATAGWSATRVFDIVIATMALIVLAPLLALVALTIVVSDPGPIFFAHKRLGKHGKTFGCLKFRSMVVDSQQRLAKLLATDPVARAEWERDHKLRNDPRVTRIGSFLRRSSLDELPQLWNVLVGDMSIVGPRPIVNDERVRYGRYYDEYCAVQPGITGLWQVSGRNDVSYRRRVACDVVYARSKSLRVDLYIMAKTVPAVLGSKGCY